MRQLSGFHHVKIPVGDVRRSREWYGRVLDLEVEIEFVEDGEVVGVSLRDTTGTVRIAARQDPARATALAGFDPLAIGVATRVELDAWRSHLDDLGERHGGIVTGAEGWVLIGLRDPDDLEVRLYTHERFDAG